MSTVALAPPKPYQPLSRQRYTPAAPLPVYAANEIQAAYRLMARGKVNCWTSTIGRARHSLDFLKRQQIAILFLFTSLVAAELCWCADGAQGGTSQYTGSLINGTMPAGIAFDRAASTPGSLPTPGANAQPPTFKLADLARMPRSAFLKVNSHVYVTVRVSQHRAALVSTQTLTLTATTNDSSGVNWSANGAKCRGADCGTFSKVTTLNDEATIYTAPVAGGIYTLRATSASDGVSTDKASVAVTDLDGVITFRNDNARDGTNMREFALRPSDVKDANFGRLSSCVVDGAIYAQPLWVPNLVISGTRHNVIFVATQHDGLFAFDADVNANPCTPLWHISLIDAAHGGRTGESPVPSSGSGALVGKGNGDIEPEVGVTGTPVIDLVTKTLYVVSKSFISAGPIFFQRLHAVDLFTGSEKFSGPVTIAGSYPGTGDRGESVTFLARHENQRAALALANGRVYIAWASHEDKLPYYGWVMAYDASTLQRAAVVNISPNVGMGGIWMSGDGPAIDESGNVYAAVGNALFDADSANTHHNDFGDSLLRFNPDLRITQYFTPSDQSYDDQVDQDLGSGGITLIDLPVGTQQMGESEGSHSCAESWRGKPNYPRRLVVGGGKDGHLYLLKRDSLGGLGDSNAWQRLDWGSPIFATPAYWNETLFMAGSGGFLQASPFNPCTGQLSTVPSSRSVEAFGFPGSSPAVTSQPDNSHAIVWAIDNSAYCTSQSHGCGPAILRAYDASDLAHELWNSTQRTGNSAGLAVKFTVPTIANGRVYIGTRGNNQGDDDATTSTPGELDVYGLLPR